MEFIVDRAIAFGRQTFLRGSGVPIIVDLPKVDHVSITNPKRHDVDQMSNDA